MTETRKRAAKRPAKRAPKQPEARKPEAPRKPKPAAKVRTATRTEQAKGVPRPAAAPAPAPAGETQLPGRMAAPEPVRQPAALRQAHPGVDEIARFHQANLDALLRTAGLAAEGAGEIRRYMFAWQREALREGLEGVRQVLGAGSVPAAIFTQAEVARRGASGLFSRSAELSRLAAAVADRASEPVRRRATTSVAALSRRAG